MKTGIGIMKKPQKTIPIPLHNLINIFNDQSEFNFDTQIFFF